MRPDKSTARQSRDVDADAAPLSLEQLLNKLDENLSCRRLVDNADIGIDLSGPPLSQLPAAAAIEAGLTALEAQGFPNVSQLSSKADAMFARAVGAEAAQGHALGGSSDRASTVERVATTITQLSGRQPNQTSIGQAGT